MLMDKKISGGWCLKLSVYHVATYYSSPKQYQIESTLEELDGYMIPREEYLFLYYISLGG